MRRDHSCPRCQGPMLHDDDGGFLCLPCKRYIPPLVQGGQGRTETDSGLADLIFAVCLVGLVLWGAAAVVVTAILHAR